MIDRPGSALNAARERQDSLVARYRAAVEADATLVATLRAAYDAARAARTRLDTLTAEVDQYRDQLGGSKGPDSGMTARELQRRVITGNREAAGIIAAAQRDAAGKAAVLRALHVQYHQR